MDTTLIILLVLHILIIMVGSILFRDVVEQDYILEERKDTFVTKVSHYEMYKMFILSIYISLWMPFTNILILSFIFYTYNKQIKELRCGN